MPVSQSRQLVIEHVPIGELRPDPFNPRHMSDEEAEALTRSVREFGLVDPIIARREDRTVIGGHQRLHAARRLGLEQVPVIFLDLGPEEAKLLNLTLNRIQGEWDKDLLARMLAELQAIPSLDLRLSGFDDEEIGKLLKSLEQREKADRPEAFDLESALTEARATEGIQPGEVWQLGDHRVMCGDSTSASDVAKLMAGQQARLLLTDPPYGVAYQGAADGRSRRSRPIANDQLGDGQAAFWRSAFLPWPLEGDVYVFSPSGPMIFELAGALEATGMKHHQWLVWVKQQLVLGRSHYHYRHEHIFYGWKGKSSWNGSRTEDSVWQIDRPQSSPDHPTMKPLALCERAIENSSNFNDLIIDPFLGSGSSLIAADRRGRRCHGMEIDPVYCRVAIARWEGFTGGHAESVPD